MMDEDDLSERERLLQEVNTAFIAAQCAFDDLHALHLRMSELQFELRLYRINRASVEMYSQTENQYEALKKQCREARLHWEEKNHLFREASQRFKEWKHPRSEQWEDEFNVSSTETLQDKE